MPIYEYRCDKGHEFEVLQRMSDDSLTSCEVCNAPAQRVLSAPAVHFKGSGFYSTDYAKKKGKDSSPPPDSSSSSDTKTKKSESSSSSSASSSSSSSSSSNGSGSGSSGGSSSSGSSD